MSTESGVTPPNAIEAYVAGMVEGFGRAAGDNLILTQEARAMYGREWGMTPEQIIDAKRRLDELVEDLGR